MHKKPILVFDRGIFRNEYFWIFILALMLRWLYLWQAFQNNPLIDFPMIDANDYINWARQILAGRFLHQRVTYTPVYPFYLAAIFLFIKNPFWVFALFHVLGAVQALLLGKIAERVFNRRAGVVTAFLAATYWPWIVYEATFHAENFALWTLILALYLFLRAWDQKPGLWFISGGLFTLAALARPNIFLAVPVLLFWLYRAAPNRRTALSNAVRFAAPMIVLVVPLLIYNYQLTGAFMLRDQGMLTLYLGNNPDFGGLVPRSGLDFRNVLFEPTAHGYFAQADQERYWLAKTLGIIQQRFPEWLVLQGKKLLMNLGSFEISQEFDIYYYRNHSRVLALFWPGAWLIIPVGLAGVLLLWRRNRETRWLALLWLALFLSILPGQAASRYRFVMMPLLMLFAGAFLAEVFRTAADRRWPELARMLAPVLVFGLVSWPDYLNLHEKNKIYTIYQMADKAFNLQRDPELAKKLYAQSLKLNPEDDNSRYWLAYLAAAEDRHEEARRYLQDILDRKPNSPDVWWLLAETYWREGNIEKANDALNRALTLAPNFNRALNLKKRLLLPPMPRQKPK